MDEGPFKNREIKEMFVDVQNGLERIEKQTTATNGRVGKLENWRWFITGGLTILAIVVVPLLAWALWVLVNINTTVHLAVDQSLSAYDVNIK